MVAILLVNGCRFVQFRQRFLMKLLEAIAMQVLASVIFGTATGRGFPPPRRIRVNLAAQLQRNQPFDQRKIIQRTRDVAMPRIPLPVARNGGREMLNGVLVSALASRDPSIG